MSESESQKGRKIRKNRLVVEIKALVKLENVHLAQAKNYTIAYDFPLGLGGHSISLLVYHQISMRTSILPTLILSIISMSVIGQDKSSFHPFEGTVYRIERENIKLGFGMHIYNYEQIQEVTWDSLHFPEGYTQNGFPGIRTRSSFGIILNSELEIGKRVMLHFFNAH